MTDTPASDVTGFLRAWTGGDESAQHKLADSLERAAPKRTSLSE